MASRDEAKFDKALDKAGIALDARDRAAALPVFRALAASCALLKSAEATTHEPR
ncbi:hypothetical protein [uncultured Paracoccus sp.]|uniref:hypothetical protein n=1 Tax=uncultured Paracoccus sp. TaxID=189685 RepID=UPI002602A0FF|nr:hypothetical protein [uncultured Paracoccus sp.]